jgi:VanZ family protein
MRGIRHFLKYHLPALAYAGLIIAISSWPNIPTNRIHIVGLDKLAHFCEYGLFAVLAFRSFSRLTPRITPSLAALMSMLFLVLFAAADEYYQHIVPGRFSDFWDMLADSVGGGLVLLFLWYRRREKQASQAQ